jgi:hypothetical protein
MALRDKSTPDQIVLLLSITVCAVILMSTMLVIGVLIWGTPSTAGQIVGKVADLTNSLIAVIVGYVGGRGASAITNGNGRPPLPPEKIYRPPGE